MRDGSGGIIVTSEEYFNEMDQRIQRIFSNQISPYDRAGGFKKEEVHGDNQKGDEAFESDALVDNNYKPDSYELPSNSPLASEDTAILTILALASPDEPKTKTTEKFVQILNNPDYPIPEETKSYMQEASQYAPIGLFTMQMDSLFGSDEYRRLNSANMPEAYEYTRKIVKHNDTSKMEKVILNGLKAIRYAYNSRGNDAAIGAARNYIYCHLCEQALKLVDKLNIPMKPADREYYEGMSRYAKLIRTGEAILDKQADGKSTTPEEKEIVDKYVSFQNLVASENNEIGRGVLSEKGQQKYVDISETIRVNNRNRGKKIKKSDQEKSTFYDTLAGQGAAVGQMGVGAAAMKADSALIQQLGKASLSKKEDDFWKEINNKALVQKENSQYKEVSEQVNAKIKAIHPDKSATAKIKEDSKYHVKVKKKNEITKALKEAKADDNTAKTSLEEQLAKFDDPNYNKEQHRNHPEFRAIMQAAQSLEDAIVKSDATLDREKCARDLREATERYLNIKDPKQIREFRAEDKYANRRYNVALNLYQLANRVDYKGFLLSGLVKEIQKDKDFKKSLSQMDNLSEASKEKAVEVLLYGVNKENVIDKMLMHEHVDVAKLAEEIRKDVKNTFIALSKSKKENITKEEFNNQLQDKLSGAIKQIMAVRAKEIQKQREAMIKGSMKDRVAKFEKGAKVNEQQRGLGKH